MIGDGLLSWDLVSAFVVGFLFSKVWSVLRVCWLDRRHPLPDGKRRSKMAALSIDRRAIAMVLGLSLVAWSVYTTQDNANEADRLTREAKTFAVETRECQKILIESILESRRLTDENNDLSRRGDDALANWLRLLLNPPEPIASLDGNDPRRQAWAVGVTGAQFRIIADAQAEQDRNDAERRMHPLPTPECGRGGG